MYLLPLLQASNAPSSNLHTNVLLISDLKLNVALVNVVGFAGFPVIVVIGGVVSTVQALALAADLSALPTESRAFT